MPRDSAIPHTGDETTILAEAAAFSNYPTLAELTAETLRGISRRQGVDFATALLYDRVKRSPEHAPFIQQITVAAVVPSAVKPGILPGGTIVDSTERVEAPGDSPGGKTPPSRSGETPGATVAIVPAAFYKEKPHSGADGRVVREAATRLGLRCELIPLQSTGTLAENFRILLDWLETHRMESVILISLCKGGADVKFALASPEAGTRFSNVIAWINICGTLKGSPVAQWLLATKPRFFATWVFCKCKRLDFDFLRELAPSPQGPLSAPLRLPPALRLINIVGFPLQRHLTNAFMRRCYGIISTFGPNDGGVLLADACQVPGVIYPVWGADHYLRPETRARQIIAAVLQRLTTARSPSELCATHETPAIDRTARTSSA